MNEGRAGTVAFLQVAVKRADLISRGFMQENKIKEDFEGPTMAELQQQATLMQQKVEWGITQELPIYFLLRIVSLFGKTPGKAIVVLEREDGDSRDRQ